FQVDPAASATSVVNSGTIKNDGGYILITAAQADDLVSSVVNVSGTVDASSSTANGGLVEVYGKDVTIASTAEVRADGATGGGKVLLGGDKYGAGTSNAFLADSLVLEKGSVLSAAATVDGDGGFVETSAATGSFAPSSVEISGAGTGTGGLWLIDPTNLEIITGGVAVIPGYTGIDPAPLVTVLQGGSGNSATVFTASPDPDVGNIVVTSGFGSITDIGSGVGLLTLTADNALTIDSAINTDGRLTLNAGAGGINIDANVTVDGNFTLNSGGIIDASGFAVTTGSLLDVNASGFDVILNGAGNDFGGQVDVAGNAIFLVDSNAIVLGNIVAANTLNVNAGGTITQAAATTIDANGDPSAVFNSNGNAITLDNAGNDFSNEVDLIATGSTATIRDDNALQLSGVQALNLTVNAGGDVTDSAADTIVVSNLTQITTTGAVTLTQGGGGHNFGTFAAAGTDIAVTDTNGIIFGDIDASGSLTVIAGGAVTQLAGGMAGDRIDVGTTTNIDATGSAISLIQVANDFGGAVSAVGTAIALTDRNGIQLGTVTASNTLRVTSLGGAITDTVGESITVANAATFFGGGAGPTEAVILDNDEQAAGAHDFGGPVNAIAESVVLHDANDIQLGSITAIGSTSLTVVATGDITDTAGSSVATGGTVNLTADSDNSNVGDVVLDNDPTTLPGAHGLGTVNASGVNVTVKEASLILVGTVTTKAGGTLLLETGFMGAGIINAGGSAITAVGLTDLRTRGGLIILDQGHDFQGRVDANTAIGGATPASVSLNDDTGGLVLGTVTASDLTLVSSDGAINDVATLAITATGTTTITATDGAGTNFDVQFDNDAPVTHDFGGPVVITAANDVQLDDINGIEFGDVTVNSMDATSHGNGGDIEFNGVFTGGPGNDTITALDGSVIVNNTVVGGGGTFDVFADQDFLVTPAGTFANDGGDATMVANQRVILRGDLTVLNGALSITADADANSVDNITIDGGVTVTGDNALTLAIGGTGRLLDAGGPDLDITLVGASLTLPRIVITDNNLVLSTVAPNAASQAFDDTNSIQVEGPTHELTVLTDGQSVTLDHAGNDFDGPVNVDTSNGGVSAPADVVVFDGATDLYLGSIVANNLTATAAGDNIFDVDGRSISAAGTSLFTVSGGGMVELNGDHDFVGAVSVDTASGGPGNVVLNDVAGGIVLGTVTAADLTVTSSDGDITDSAGQAITVAGMADLSATDGAGTDFDVLLDESATHDFQGQVDAYGGTVYIDDLSDIQLGTVTATSPMTLTIIAAGDIDDTPGLAITSVGPANFFAGGHVWLDNSTPFTHDLNEVNADGTSIILRDVDDIQLGNINTAGDLTVETFGPITSTADSGPGGNVNVGGLTTLDSNGNDITLDAASNDFNEVDADGANIVLADIDDIQLGTVTATGDLSVTAGGQIDDVAGEAITVGGLTTLTATGFDILLDNSPALHDLNEVDADGVNIVLVDVDDIQLGTVTATGDLSVTAGGQIDDV
ncbi:MAG: hypothetical protein KDB37_16775, partial [Ilumatobacter sp.]|nr:hypothetical protein [Ilumatobacter sp.]